MPATGVRTPGVDTAATLFGESASRAVVSVTREQRGPFMQLAAQVGVPALAIGFTGGSRLRMAVAGEIAIDCPLGEAETTWAAALERRLAKRGVELT